MLSRWQLERRGEKKANKCVDSQISGTMGEHLKFVLHAAIAESNRWVLKKHNNNSPSYLSETWRLASLTQKHTRWKLKEKGRKEGEGEWKTEKERERGGEGVITASINHPGQSPLPGDVGWIKLSTPSARVSIHPSILSLSLPLPRSHSAPL